MHVWESRGHVRTVYSQMNERVTGEVIKNHVKKNKNQRRPQSVSLERSPDSSHSGVLFFLLFPAILLIPIQSSLLPISLSPTGPPSRLFPLLFFLPVPVLFLLPLSLSFSVFLTFYRRPCSPFSPHSLPLSPSSVH